MATLHHGTSPLTEVVGANCRRVRNEMDMTQNALAQYAQAVGLRWNAAKLANFEAGRWEFTLTTVLLVGMALQKAMAFAVLAAPAMIDREILRNRVITLADMFAGADGLIALNDSVAIEAGDLMGIANGAPFPDPRYVNGGARRSDLAEDRLAKALGVTSARLEELSLRLWDVTFSEERDRRAGDDANQQKRGRISRELRAEIEKALADGHD